MSVARRVAVVAMAAELTMGCIFASEEEKRTEDRSLAEVASEVTVKTSIVEASWDRTAHDARTVSGARLVVTLAGPAFGRTSHCPRLTEVRGTANGAPLRLVNEGGSRETRGCNSSVSTWSCDPVALEIDALPEADRVVIELADDSSTWTMELGPWGPGHLAWVTPSTGVLVRGRPATLDVDLPGVTGPLLELTFVGPPQPGSRDEPSGGFVATGTLSGRSLTFTVPSSSDELDGQLRIVSRQARLSTLRCDGPVGCEAAGPLLRTFTIPGRVVAP